jgi:hypothetical protein
LIRFGRVPLLALLACVATSSGAGAQLDGAYRDPIARRLHEAAMANRERLDDSVISYTALVKQRFGAALRTPLKDRTLYRAESAHRVFWNRDGETLVQVLALREQTPVGVTESSTHGGLFDEPFDPMNDRLLFGFADRDDELGEPGEDDFWFEHPLYEEYVDGYVFSSGDTLTVALPDGRRISAVELRVVPREADVHRMTGSLWIEPETGALVRAVYRLSDTFDLFRDIADLREEEDEDLKFIPGFLKPWTFELSLIAVDYALWDFDVWLPRSLRAEGVATAGILKAPATVDLSYRMEDVVTERDLAADSEPEEVREVHFRTRSEAFSYLATLTASADVPFVMERGWTRSRGRRVRFMVPEDPSYLATSPELPPPVWKDAPGFTTEDELEEMFRGLADLPTAPVRSVPRTLRWGLQRPDLVRYNRIEGLSLGARWQLRPQSFLGPLSVTVTGRLGVGDLQPNARIDVTRETIERKVTLSGYRELAAIDEKARHLGLGNSLMAAAFGRDDGDYFRRTGASIEWTPPTASRRSFRVLAYTEYHEAVARDAKIPLFRAALGGFHFRDNIRADEGWESGGVLEVSPWWGSDPNLVQGGLDGMVQAATGDWEYARASLVGRLAVPLPGAYRMGLEVGGGTSRGRPPPQRLWWVGGPSTLRGFDPRAMGGPRYARARIELARLFPVGAVSLFSDGAWAGEGSAFSLDSARYSIGLGLSALDGLIRFDAAWGVHGGSPFRFDAYLDAIL